MKIREAEHKGRGRGGRARDNESIFLSVQFLSLSLFDLYFGCVCQFVIQYWLDKGPREIRNCCHQPTHFNNTLVFALSKADRATHNKALYSIWLENHLAQQLAGNKQNITIINHHHQCNDTKDHQFPTCSARLQS